MSRRLLIAVLAGCICLLAPALSMGAHAPALHATAASVSVDTPLPTIARVKPLRLKIGERLTIVGRHFIPGRRKNTVVFLRDGAPAVFLKAQTATRTRLTVLLTSKLGRYLIAKNNGEKGPTRFRLRVLARRFGPSFTPRRLSPVVLPATPQQDGGSRPVAPTVPVCSLETARAAPDADADGDALSNGLELQIHTDPCLADSDGDAISDGYEYESALDYNTRALPYPGKRPYPNPLDPTDRSTDYDGDGLLMSDEYAAWVLYGHSTFPLNYSDGTQTTGGPVQTTPETRWQDINGDGFLTDDEKDIDGDGLTNWDEAWGRMWPLWWRAVWKSEQSYPLPYEQTLWLDPDTDGDGLTDGADDVDEDDWANRDEIVRESYWVQPFNPCLPNYRSRSCTLHPPVDNTFPPFRTGDIRPGEEPPLVWPR